MHSIDVKKAVSIQNGLKIGDVDYPNHVTLQTHVICSGHEEKNRARGSNSEGGARGGRFREIQRDTGIYRQVDRIQTTQ